MTIYYVTARETITELDNKRLEDKQAKIYNLECTCMTLCINHSPFDKFLKSKYHNKI